MCVRDCEGALARVCVCVCTQLLSRSLSLWELHAVVISLLIITEDFADSGRGLIFVAELLVIAKGVQLYLNTLTPGCLAAKRH